MAISFPGASAPLRANIISYCATRVKPQTRFPWKKPLPGAWASAPSPLGRQIPRPSCASYEKTSPGNGVNGLPCLLRPFSAFSARVTHAQDPFFAPETIARRRPVPPPPLWMDDMRDATPVSREEAARRGTRDGGRRPILPPPALFMGGRANGRWRECIYNPTRTYTRVRAPACSNEKENYLKITCCSLR